jgi:hypothetical protein
MTEATSEVPDGTERVTISLPRTVAREVRAAAEDEHVTISGWVGQSIQDRLLVRRMRTVLDEYQAEHGEITEEEIAAVRREGDERSARWR